MPFFAARCRALSARTFGFAAALGLTLITANAEAHLRLTSPPARNPAVDLKDGPCGLGPADVRTTDPTKITVFAPGETITLAWTETVDHDPAHYRISFSRYGDTEFSDPTGYDDIQSAYPVLLDGIPDADVSGTHDYTAQVTLPTEPCDTCTLQVIQVMHDKPPWGAGGGEDIYYQCADIVIESEPDSMPEPGGAGAPGVPEGSGGAFSNPSGTGGSSVEPEEPPPEGEEESTEEAAGCSCQSAPGKRADTFWGALAACLVLLGPVLVRRARLFRSRTS